MKFKQILRRRAKSIIRAMQKNRVFPMLFNTITCHSFMCCKSYIDICMFWIRVIRLFYLLAHWFDQVELSKDRDVQRWLPFFSKLLVLYRAMMRWN